MYGEIFLMYEKIYNVYERLNIKNIYLKKNVFRKLLNMYKMFLIYTKKHTMCMQNRN